LELVDRLCPQEDALGGGGRGGGKAGEDEMMIVVEEDSSTKASTTTTSSTPSVANNETALPCLPLLPLPTVPASRLKREFELIGLNGVEVTSLDITAHGCYVVAGLGNGMVLLFDMTQPLSEGALIGQIVAKGLHTNLLLTVKITEDCRFCFAGVTKGSSELLAIDLGRLPIWPSTPTGVIRRAPCFVHELISRHSRSDPKLRGFGAAVRVRQSDELAPAKYRLACGRGIKNVHVWQFVPARNSLDAPLWTCIYDVASNGNTIESVGFRNGGLELLSKSAGVNLRVWDLKGFDTDPLARPAFEDIANSSDVRSLLDSFAFGGTYEFAVVRLAAPKAANRDSLEVPERCPDGQLKRRYPFLSRF